MSRGVECRRSGTMVHITIASGRAPDCVMTHAPDSRQVAAEAGRPVSGPLLLGDGRFLGFGLMQPDDEQVRSVIAFAITGGMKNEAEPRVVAGAARRAMMARVQDGLPYGAPLPPYVIGHRLDGAPAGDGTHGHVAVVADLRRARLLYLAPTELQRRGAFAGGTSKSKDHRRARRRGRASRRTPPAV